MKILAVADEVSSYLYKERFDKDHFEDQYGEIDAIVSCGDLKPTYLQFLSSVFQEELYYVRGNHDSRYKPGKDGYRGLVNLDGTLKTIQTNNGSDRQFTIAGMEGSIYYSPDQQRVQYTEWQMKRRIWKLQLSMKLKQLVGPCSLDIFVAHSDRYRDSVPQGAHRGFKSFNTFFKKVEPKVFLHGHTHHYCDVPEQEIFHNTRVINVVGYKVVEVE